MSYAGISVTKELVALAAVADETACYELSVPGQDNKLSPVPIELLTFPDGRAFRGSAHFNRWKNSGEFLLHENDIQEVDTARALYDFCQTHGCSHIGYTPSQTRIAAANAVAIENLSVESKDALATLNVRGREFRGCLFPPNTVLQHMWNSLPMDGGERVFPEGKRLARGRWDGIRAVTNAMACAKIVQRREMTERGKAEREKFEAVVAGWEAMSPDTKVWIYTHSMPGTLQYGRQIRPMREALPLLKQGAATWVGLADE